ncbi:endonuclease III [Endomicrobium proavitum]|uniref:Endonuclease III n=1 Tax=Endomicrobium proavitum TaxID=1408281 RepID=A0A0G3WGW5_9BACT|nr:endonuclease III [Endomicrobium proavitum]AKL97563.1 DNA glycosylase and apyrimidinic (AP) lyase (endonuclease III) [Endomicrobium proavitum]
MKQNKKEYVAEIIKLLLKSYKKVKCALNYKEPYELLFATILSAQCTDERVNKVTEELFKKYRAVADYANADVKELEVYIRSAGFYRNKAKNIINSAKVIIEKYDGKVPQSMQELLVLPGVARKTANVVLGNAFNKAEGIAVDTHVIRIANLLKLTKSDNPVKIEQDLMEIVPKKYWTEFSHLLQTLGRRVCKARNPNCSGCSLKEICPSAKA